jgi:hypothetical protein
MMNRRDFFKFLPVAPLVIVSDVKAMAHADDAPDTMVNTLTLQNYKKINPKNVRDVWAQRDKYFSDFPLQGRPQFAEKTMVQASLSVGSDGHLWIKPNNNGKWKRVVTE